SRIFSIRRPAGKGMKRRVAGAIGSNSKDGAEVIRAAIIRNAVQITVAGSGQTRRGGVPIVTCGKGIKYGLHTCWSHLVDATQIVGSTKGSRAVKIAVG